MIEQLGVAVVHEGVALLGGEGVGQAGERCIYQGVQRLTEVEVVQVAEHRDARIREARKHPVHEVCDH